ncbi:MAG: tRNA pseudouridine(55) synthase TruB [Patescibacteria group bacterium]|mgnify:CR=1 FL=1
MSGFLLIDKPIGPTSHDIVDKIRRITGEKRVGHAGTLDPFASGLLIIGVGREATREFPKLVGLDKTYEAVFVLGASSDTDDRMGTITPRAPLPTSPLAGGGGHDAIADALKQFTGEISQIPPAYSAIKIGGKKMYEAAREGKPLEAKPRTVTIHSIKIGPIHAIEAGSSQTLLPLIIHCSTGTYIRAIARDLGQALGTGGYVQELRRTSIGPFTISESVSLEKFKTEDWKNLLVSAESLLARL